MTRDLRGTAAYQVANITPIPTTAAVSATGIQTCADLRRISVMISPTFLWPPGSGQDPRWNSTPAPDCQSFEGSESRGQYMKCYNAEEPKGQYFKGLVAAPQH